MSHNILGADVGEKINNLESRFKQLQRCLISELTERQPQITYDELLMHLSMLPTKLVLECQKFVERMVDSVEEIKKFFLYLNKFVTFIGYRLLKYIIDCFGSADLRRSMNEYEQDILQFYCQTTISQLMRYFPGQENLDPDLKCFMLRIDEDPESFTLQQLNEKRNRMCGQFKLRDCVFTLIGCKHANSFTAMWSVHHILVDDVIESAKQIEKSVYDIESILHISINGIQLYPGNFYV